MTRAWLQLFIIYRPKKEIWTYARIYSPETCYFIFYTNIDSKRNTLFKVITLHNIVVGASDGATTEVSTAVSDYIQSRSAAQSWSDSLRHFYLTN
jgi:hypothetical protein